MEEYFFTFRSITTAQRAVRVLDSAGISNALLRTPKEISRMGCGYSVRVRAGAFAQARQALQQSEVDFSNAYRRGANGRWEAVQG